MSKNFKLILDEEDVKHNIYLLSFTHRTDKSERTVFIEKKFETVEEAEAFIKNYGFNFTSAEESVLYKMTAIRVYSKK